MTQFLLGFVILAYSFVSPLYGQQIDLSDTSPAQGTIVRTSIDGSNLCNPVIRFQSRDIPLHTRNGQWRGLLGIDLGAEPGEAEVRLRATPCQDGGTITQKRTMTIRPGDYPTQHLTIEDEEKTEFSSEDLKRIRRESRQIDRALSSQIENKLWYLPFAHPVDDISPGNSFGARRVINGQPRNPHSGEDYEADVGDPIRSIVAGRVSLIGHFFFAGRAVFINHGHSLHSMYFHLSEIDVEEDDFIQEGERIGKAGMSGRTTGPHLHLGIRLNGNTVDPDQLLFPDN